MATRNETLKITLEVDGEGRVRAGVQNAERAFKSFGDRVVSLNQGLELLSKGYDLVTTAGRAVLGFASQAVAASNEQEDAISLLNATLNTSGQFTAVYSQELQDLASELQNTTKFGDEVVLNIERQLVAFGAAPEQVGRFTRAALDLAVGLRGSGAGARDAQSAALLLGKALAGDFGTLGRYGIKVSENATATEKLEQAVSQIEQRFGGSAAAAAATFQGQVTQLNNVWGDFLELVGDAIKETPELQAVLIVSKEILLDLQEAVKGASGSIITEFVGKAIAGAIEVTGVATVFIGNLVFGFEALHRAIMLLAGNPAEVIADIQERGLAPMAAEVFKLTERVADFQVRFEAAANRVRAEAKETASTIETGNTRAGRSYDDIVRGAANTVAELNKVPPAAAAAGKAAEESAAKTKSTYQQAQEQLGVLRGEYEIFGKRFSLVETRITVDNTQALKAVAETGAAIDGLRRDAAPPIPLTIASAISQDAARGREIAAQRRADAAAARGGGGSTAAAPFGGIETVNFGGQLVFDPFDVFQKLRLDTFQNPIVVPVEAEGSPRMPFSKYFTEYAPKLIGALAGGVGGAAVSVRTGLTSEIAALIREADELRAVADRFGTSRPQLGRNLSFQTLGSQPGAGHTFRADTIQFFNEQKRREQDVVSELNRIERRIFELMAEQQRAAAAATQASERTTAATVSSGERIAKELRAGFSVFYGGGFTRHVVTALEGALSAAKGTPTRL